MKGLGRGLVSLASSLMPSIATDADSAEQKRRRDAALAASAAS
jgi:hypothetical protein